MTTEDLAEIAERLNGITPGPWKQIGDIYIYSPLGAVADVPIFEDREFVFQMRGVGRGATMKEQQCNLEFIAHARTDIPSLLSEVNMLTIELGLQRALVESMSRRIEELETPEGNSELWDN